MTYREGINKKRAILEEYNYYLDKGQAESLRARELLREAAVIMAALKKMTPPEAPL